MTKTPAQTFTVSDTCHDYPGRTVADILDDLVAGQGRASFLAWIEDGAQGELDLSDPGLRYVVKAA